MSLRAELIGASPRVPGFALVLPDGWASFDTAAKGLKLRADKALAALSPAQRTALTPAVREMFTTMSSTGEKRNVIRVFAQNDVPAESFLPVSLVAARLDAPGGRDITSVGMQMISSRGAAPMDDAKTILRWQQTSTVAMEGGSVSSLTINYLLPVPNQPTLGLIFQASILQSADGTDIDPAGLQMMTALCDAIVSTVRWARDA